jgi:hypothetical protein
MLAINDYLSLLIVVNCSRVCGSVDKYDYVEESSDICLNLA